MERVLAQGRAQVEVALGFQCPGEASYRSRTTSQPRAAQSCSSNSKAPGLGLAQEQALARERRSQAGANCR
jgi:hypothetical protein